MELIEFRSSKFPAYPGEEEEINPGIWGRRLSEYLVPKLEACGYKVEDVDQEDFGYLIQIKHDDVNLEISCGHQYGDDDVFVCSVSSQKPLLSRFLKKADNSGEEAKLLYALQQILKSDPEVRDIAAR